MPEQAVRGAKTCDRLGLRVKIHTTDETAEISGGAWTVHVQDRIDFLFPGLETTGCEPITKPVRFLDGPFALKRVYSETIVAKATENIVEKSKWCCHEEEKTPTSSM
jgi:hypothetical protein